MLTRPRRRLAMGRAGMTLVEVVVVIVVLTMIAGVVTPQVLQRLRNAQSGALATNLQNLSSAMTGFRGDVGRYPRQLAYLGAPIAAGAFDSCGNVIPDPSTWKGPYLSRTVPTGGLALQGMIIQNATERVVVSGNVGTLLLVVLNVDSQIATELETAFDGTPANLTSGTIRWTAGSGGQGTMRYAVPIRGC